jgi:hypothetical protein
MNYPLAGLLPFHFSAVVYSICDFASQVFSELVMLKMLSEVPFISSMAHLLMKSNVSLPQPLTFDLNRWILSYITGDLLNCVMLGAILQKSMCVTKTTQPRPKMFIK